jgi:hypothetical protein
VDRYEATGRWSARSEPRVLSAKAVLIEEDLGRGRRLADALLDRIGSCPSRLLPDAERRLNSRASITVGEYYEGWIARQKPPLVRPTNAEKHRYYFEGVILPFWRHVPLVEVRGARLKEFQASLFERRVCGRPIKVKTARNIIDGHFRALLRDAREELDHLPLGDPFRSLRWPKEVKDAPDPFTPGERDRILEFYSVRRPNTPEVGASYLSKSTTRILA